MSRITLSLTAMLMVSVPATALAAPPADAAVESGTAGSLIVHWTSPDPVDVLVADHADAPAAKARLVSVRDRDGSHLITLPGERRSYFVLRNSRTGEIARVAERPVPLERGSNFRDIGGYAAAGGKHVRWGMIYRSGATPLISETDQNRIRALGLANMIDLRSDEERVLAPSRIEGVPYTAIGYRMGDLNVAGGMEPVYRNLPKAMAPQLKQVFAKLLRDEGPLVYNCSAGQDRTGFVTAMILTALGTPRDVILAD